MIRRRALATAAVVATVLAAGSSGLAFVLPPAQAQRIATTQEKAREPAVYRLGDLTVSEIWAHQSTPRDGAAYLRIGNAGKDDDALIDASTPFAKRVELRGPVPASKNLETGRIDAIPAPARQAIELTAASVHLRLVGLRGNLSVGGTVRVTLTFEQAGAITVEARVLSANDATAIIEKIVPQTVEPETPGAPVSTPAPPAGRQ